MDLHRPFLKALKGDRFYVKVVVNPKTTPEEITLAASLVATEDASVPFFIQPESTVNAVAGGDYLVPLWNAARKEIRTVRVVPQIHKLLSLM